MVKHARGGQRSRTRPEKDGPEEDEGEIGCVERTLGGMGWDGKGRKEERENEREGGRRR